MGAVLPLTARAYRGGVRLHDGMLSFFCHGVAKTPKNKKGQERQAPDLRFLSGGPCGTRTHDLRIKSPLLYQLS